MLEEKKTRDTNTIKWMMIRLYALRKGFKGGNFLMFGVIWSICQNLSVFFMLWLLCDMWFESETCKYSQ